MLMLPLSPEELWKFVKFACWKIFLVRLFTTLMVDLTIYRPYNCTAPSFNLTPHIGVKNWYFKLKYG